MPNNQVAISYITKARKKQHAIKAEQEKLSKDALEILHNSQQDLNGEKLLQKVKDGVDQDLSYICSIKNQLESIKQSNLQNLSKLPYSLKVTNSDNSTNMPYLFESAKQQLSEIDALDNLLGMKLYDTALEAKLPTTSGPYWGTQNVTKISYILHAATQSLSVEPVTLAVSSVMYSSEIPKDFVIPQSYRWASTNDDLNSFYFFNSGYSFGGPRVIGSYKDALTLKQQDYQVKLSYSEYAPHDSGSLLDSLLLEPSKDKINDGKPFLVNSTADLMCTYNELIGDKTTIPAHWYSEARLKVVEQFEAVRQEDLSVGDIYLQKHIDPSKPTCYGAGYTGVVVGFDQTKVEVVSINSSVENNFTGYVQQEFARTTQGDKVVFFLRLNEKCTANIPLSDSIKDIQYEDTSDLSKVIGAIDSGIEHD